MALPSKGSELLLVIDQFEELFILVEDEKEREHFLGLLHKAVTDKESIVRVVVTTAGGLLRPAVDVPGIRSAGGGAVGDRIAADSR